MIRVSGEDKMRLRNKAPDLVINSETMNRINKTTPYNNEAKNIDDPAKPDFHTNRSCYLFKPDRDALPTKCNRGKPVISAQVKLNPEDSKFKASLGCTGVTVSNK